MVSLAGETKYCRSKFSEEGTHPSAETASVFQIVQLERATTTTGTDQTEMGTHTEQRTRGLNKITGTRGGIGREIATNLIGPETVGQELATKDSKPEDLTMCNMGIYKTKMVEESRMITGSVTKLRSNLIHKIKRVFPN